MSKDDPLVIAEQWLQEGRRIALATVIETWGSAPRPIGSHLVIDNEGNFEGSVSGGCVESAVVFEAIDIIESQQGKILEFGVADETAWEVGLSCGGRIRVYVEPIGQVYVEPIGEAPLRNIESLSVLNSARKSRKPVAVITTLSSGVQRMVDKEKSANDPLKHELQAKWQAGKSGAVVYEEQEYFIQTYRPSPRLILIGAVHISQTLVMLAKACQFDVTVVDPRTAFATPERFGNVDLLAEWPQEVLSALKLDPFTAVAALTHDPKIDDVPLQAALKAECFYVGALGSRKTHAKRKIRLLEAGVSDAMFDRIQAPIGLNIAAANPAEIAVAVMAQIIEFLHKGQNA